MLRLQYQKKYFTDVQFLTGEKNSWKLSGNVGVRDNGLRFLAYQELQIQIPPGSRQVMKMRIKYNFKNPTYVHGKRELPPGLMKDNREWWGLWQTRGHTPVLGVNHC